MTPSARSPRSTSSADRTDLHVQHRNGQRKVTGQYVVSSGVSAYQVMNEVVQTAVAVARLIPPSPDTATTCMSGWTRTLAAPQLRQQGRHLKFLCWVTDFAQTAACPGMSVSTAGPGSDRHREPDWAWHRGHGAVRSCRRRALRRGARAGVRLREQRYFARAGPTVRRLCGTPIYANDEDLAVARMQHVPPRPAAGLEAHTSTRHRLPRPSRWCSVHCC